MFFYFRHTHTHTHVRRHILLLRPLNRNVTWGRKRNNKTFKNCCRKPAFLTVPGSCSTATLGKKSKNQLAQRWEYLLELSASDAALNQRPHRCLQMIARSDTDSPWQRVLTRSLRSTSTPTDPLTPPSFELQLSKLHWLLAVTDKNVLCPKKNNIEELLKIGSRPTSQLVAWIMKHTFLLPGSRKIRF